MSEVRLKYGQLAPEGLAKMTALEHYLNNGTGLEASLRELEHYLNNGTGWRFRCDCL